MSLDGISFVENSNRITNPTNQSMPSRTNGIGSSLLYPQKIKEEV